MLFVAGVRGLPPSFRESPSSPNHEFQAAMTASCSSLVSGIEPPPYRST